MGSNNTIDLDDRSFADRMRKQRGQASPEQVIEEPTTQSKRLTEAQATEALIENCVSISERLSKKSHDMIVRATVGNDLHALFQEQTQPHLSGDREGDMHTIHLQDGKSFTYRRTIGPLQSHGVHWRCYGAPDTEGDLILALTGTMLIGICSDPNEPPEEQIEPSISRALRFWNSLHNIVTIGSLLPNGRNPNEARVVIPDRLAHLTKLEGKHAKAIRESILDHALLGSDIKVSERPRGTVMGTRFTFKTHHNQMGFSIDIP
jgi:hypothetical protein